MAEIPKYDDWMGATAAGIFTPRSRELKAVDTALQAYWRTVPGPERQPKRRAIGSALADWIGTKGPDWRSSERNKPPRRIVSQLYDALNTTMFTEQDLEAFEYQDKRERQRLWRIFSGKEIVWKGRHGAKTLTGDHLDIKELSPARGKLWQPDAEAVKKIKDAHQQQAADRAEYGQGKEQLARDVLGPGLTAGANIASLARDNVNPGLGHFGLNGTSSSPGDFMKMAHDLCGGMGSISEIGSYFSQFGVDLKQIAMDTTPIVSNIFSGTKVLLAWGKLCLAKYREYKIAQQSGFVMPGGDVAEAFKALQVLLNRQVWTEGVQAGMQTADFATRTALTFVDGGLASSVAVGAAFGIAKLLHKLSLLGREYAETRHAQRLLADPVNLGARIFSSYPLLGCYMLLCSDTNSVINIVRAGRMRQNAIRFGDLAWKQQVEWIKKNNLDPVLERAAAMVYASPFLVRDSITKMGMPVHAVYQVDFLDKAQKKFSSVDIGMGALGLAAQFAG